MSDSSSLTKELNAWIEHGGDLSDVLSPNDHEVRTREEASTVVAAIRHLQTSDHSSAGSTISSPLHYLAALFQQVESREAFDTLADDGLPLLRSEVERSLTGESEYKDDILFLLKILAMYQREEDVDLIARVARSSYEADGYMWSVIFSRFGDDHPYASRFVDALRQPLPEGFMAVAFLDLCNGLTIEGKLETHPFRSQQGVSQLKQWLMSVDPDEFSYAHSATAAIPFLPKGARDSLLQIANDHKDLGVRLEAAWATAKSGDSSGLGRLVEYCRDPNHSSVAQRYLTELGAAGEIPDECKDPDFQAIAEMANWLAHPNEFGRPPTSIELFDTRMLYWPPTEDRRQVWLVKYRYAEPGEEEDMGVGMVGSVTFALFGETTAELAPEDIYALHCCWELEANEDPRAPEERTVVVGRSILAERNSGF